MRGAALRNRLLAELDGVTTMADLDELALALPGTTRELSEDGRPSYLVHGRMFGLHRSRRADAVDPETGEQLDDVLVFRVDGSRTDAPRLPRRPRRARAARGRAPRALQATRTA